MVFEVVLFVLALLILGSLIRYPHGLIPR